MNEALKPYLARSAAAHAAALVAFLVLASRAGLKSQNVYMIDFVGPSVTLGSLAPAGASASGQTSPSAVPPQYDPDAIARHGRGHALPRPSLLGGAQDKDEAPETASPSTSLAGPGAAAAPQAAAGGASAGVATDLPNFPYPWYIAQVRLMLWQSWRKRMPPAYAEGSVSFSILRNGSFTDLAVESSSGDDGFDRAALESVQAAAPFPALPDDFRDPFLKIHLTLKSGTS